MDSRTRVVFAVVGIAVVVAYVIDTAMSHRISAGISRRVFDHPPAGMVSQVIDEARRITQAAAEGG